MRLQALLVWSHPAQRIGYLQKRIQLIRRLHLFQCFPTEKTFLLHVYFPSIKTSTIIPASRLAVPYVLSVFTTRVEADKKFPVLLANGNLIEKGEVGENRHYAIWQDPTKKPAYLFACVIGDLAVLKDHYVTSEGRNVALEIYAEEKDIPKCHIAMEALKHSMRWDEEHYGRPYDLDNYMIVATSAFNMGAMENKGLNIFNTSCVLANEEYTTDAAIMRVQSVIAHEYFHNWTGNRITCRDWFQLCLKEGLTVFRDQSFSSA